MRYYVLFLWDTPFKYNVFVCIIYVEHLEEDKKLYKINALINSGILHSFFSEINGCDHSPCHSNATCKNSVGSFQCFCNVGFIGSGFNCSGMISFGNIVTLPTTSCNGN